MLDTKATYVCLKRQIDRKTEAKAKPRPHNIRAAWREDQVLVDKKVSATARVVGVYLSMRVTMKETKKQFRKTGKIVVWGSQENIGDALGWSRRSIIRALAELIRRGHLKLHEKGNRYARSNKYEIVLKTAL